MPNRTGTNLILASLLATLSYLPFEAVAKFTLVVCLLVFILDPYPGSRLVAFVAVGVVLLINRARRYFLEKYPPEEEREGGNETTSDKEHSD